MGSKRVVIHATSRGDGRETARVAAVARSGGRHLLDAALELGFSDQAHFCRVFKETVGASPGRYRRFVRSLYGHRS